MVLPSSTSLSDSSLYSIRNLFKTQGSRRLAQKYPSSKYPLKGIQSRKLLARTQSRPHTASLRNTIRSSQSPSSIGSQQFAQKYPPSKNQLRVIQSGKSLARTQPRLQNASLWNTIRKNRNLITRSQFGQKYPPLSNPIRRPQSQSSFARLQQSRRHSLPSSTRFNGSNYSRSIQAPPASELNSFPYNFMDRNHVKKYGAYYDAKILQYLKKNNLVEKLNAAWRKAEALSSRSGKGFSSLSGRGFSSLPGICNVCGGIKPTNPCHACGGQKYR